MNTSIYARQWDVGSFTDPTKKPYKVSERRDGRWECSCPAWTRHTPRTDCKHIIKVQKAIRFSPAKSCVRRHPTRCQPDTAVTRPVKQPAGLRRDHRRLRHPPPRPG